MQTAASTNLLSVAAVLGLFALSIYLLVVGEGVFIPLVLAVFITYLVISLSHAIERIKFSGR
ncbi:MAG: hypothetical protein RLN70_00120, partial [Rhodospirillaceae bacterium]